jgi:hypothetical protein
MTHQPPPKPWATKFAEYWKAAIAVAGAGLIILNNLVGLNFWPERVLDWINAGIAALTAAGVWFKTNQRRAEQITGIDIDQDKTEG